MEHISTNPAICHGKPVINGTRIMVANILSLLAGGYTFTQIEEYYPELKEEQIKAAIQYAATTVQEEEIILQGNAFSIKTSLPKQYIISTNF